MNLFEVAKAISDRLTRIFLRDTSGRCEEAILRGRRVDECSQEEFVVNAKVLDRISALDRKDARVAFKRAANRPRLARRRSKD
jgi:hypothetical protein